MKRERRRRSKKDYSRATYILALRLFSNMRCGLVPILTGIMPSTFKDIRELYNISTNQGMNLDSSIYNQVRYVSAIGITCSNTVY